MNTMQKSMSKTTGLNISNIRKQFPMLSKTIRNKPFIYLDSAATAHKPVAVIKCLEEYFSGSYGKPQEEHELSKITTDAVNDARSKVARFFGAGDKEIVFTRGCTEGINMVAAGFAKGFLKKGDEILISALEHHANIVPWLMACEHTGAVLKVIPITPAGEIDMDDYNTLLSAKTKMVSVSHTSHVLGTILPVKEIIKLAHKRDIPVMLDGAQAAPHMPVDVHDLDCDFYTLSGHKMGTPTGIGVLFGKKKWLNKLPAAEGGADMAKEVSFKTYKTQDIPQKFEAGTLPFAQIIAFGVLIDFLNELDMEKSAEYEKGLLEYATNQLTLVNGVTIVGTAEEKEPVLSFHLGKKDVKKLEKYLNEEHNIFVRAGDLSAQPLMKILGVKGLLRVSFCYYNTRGEIDAFVAAVRSFIKNN
ncbi:MAG: aminotransferase class V-fold PLP-dependent enzyme [Flavisolibacter sp.]